MGENLLGRYWGINSDGSSNIVPEGIRAYTDIRW